MGLKISRGVLLSSLFVLPIGMAAAPAAQAATSTSSGSISISGALKGTFKITNTTECDATSGHGAEISAMSGSLTGLKAEHWSINLITQHNGTFTKFVAGETTFVLQSGLKGWVAGKGSLTVKGDTAKFNLTLNQFEGDAKGTVYAKGSWSCA